MRFFTKRPILCPLSSDLAVGVPASGTDPAIFGVPWRVTFASLSITANTPNQVVNPRLHIALFYGPEEGGSGTYGYNDFESSISGIPPVTEYAPNPTKIAYDNSTPSDFWQPYIGVSFRSLGDYITSEQATIEFDITIEALVDGNWEAIGDYVTGAPTALFSFDTTDLVVAGDIGFEKGQTPSTGCFWTNKLGVEEDCGGGPPVILGEWVLATGFNLVGDEYVLWSEAPDGEVWALHSDTYDMVRHSASLGEINRFVLPGDFADRTPKVIAALSGGKLAATGWTSGVGFYTAKLDSDGTVLATVPASGEFLVATSGHVYFYDWGVGFTRVIVDTWEEDTAFTANANAALPSSFEITTCAVQAGGKIVIGGRFEVIGGYRLLYRLNADGTLDSSFSDVADFPYSTAYSVAIAEDQSIYATHPAGFYTAGLSHWDANGVLLEMSAHTWEDPNDARESILFPIIYGGVLLRYTRSSYGIVFHDSLAPTTFYDDAGGSDPDPREKEMLLVDSVGRLYTRYKVYEVEGG